MLLPPAPALLPRDASRAWPAAHSLSPRSSIRPATADGLLLQCGTPAGEARVYPCCARGVGAVPCGRGGQAWLAMPSRCFLTGRRFLSPTT